MASAISAKGFKEATEKLKGMANVQQAKKFQQTLLDGVGVIADDAKNRVHSITGRTVSAIITAPGKGATPSAYVKVDRKLASVISRNRRSAYPFFVEFGHGGPHPAPPHSFFKAAIIAKRASARRIVKDGIEEVLNPYVGPSSIGGEFQ